MKSFLRSIINFVGYVFHYNRNRQIISFLTSRNKFLQEAFTFMSGKISAEIRDLRKEQDRMITHMVRGEYKAARQAAGALQGKWLELEGTIRETPGQKAAATV